MDNFDFKKFLIENKLTSNSKQITEGDQITPEDIIKAIQIVNQEENPSEIDGFDEELQEAIFPIPVPINQIDWNSPRWVIILQLLIMLIQLVMVGVPIGFAIKDEINDVIKTYNLNKKSTRQELEQAAKEIMGSLSSREKSYLNKLLKTIETEKDKNVRAHNVGLGKRAINRYKGKYGLNDGE